MGNGNILIAQMSNQVKDIWIRQNEPLVCDRSSQLLKLFPLLSLFFCLLNSTR